MNDIDEIILLQKIDCNCNNCIHMERDLATYKIWEEWHKAIELDDFEKRKARALEIANACADPLGKKTLMAAFNKMRFQFDKSKLINYGNCLKFGKKVSFIPNICQLETQRCFKHRRDAI